tara:strand:- start:8300 stop:8578 length:279 start_codon:yes stop_codon:yes gene_type:complete
MKNKQTRKPTNLELKTAINNLIMELGYIQQGMRNLDSIVSAYIDYNEDTNKFKEWLKAKYNEEKNEPNTENTTKSSKGDSQAKVRNIKSKKA